MPLPASYSTDDVGMLTCQDQALDEVNPSVLCIANSPVWAFRKTSHIIPLHLLLQSIVHTLLIHCATPTSLPLMVFKAYLYSLPADPLRQQAVLAPYRPLLNRGLFHL